MKSLLHAAVLLFAIACTPHSTSAQTTGSFDTAISFMGGTRQLAVYVPTTYTPTQKYRLMIALHGLGDSCVNYRNGLINSLGWGTAMPNTIFVCPEAETKSSDFYSFAGSETIIAESIAMAMAKYHIDIANIVLQGFSLGGRAALRYGLDNPTVFKGLLLNTPAVQGIKEAINDRAPFYSFAYANAPQVPIYITHGANDLQYTSVIDTTYEQLVRNNGIVRYYDFPGLGHTIPPIAQILNFSSFFDTPTVVKRDVEAVRFYAAPSLSCSLPARATLLFRNLGKDTLHTVKFSYKAGGTTQSGTWMGTLLPFQHATFNASFSNLMPGANSATIKVDSLEGNSADTIVANNEQTALLQYAGNALPFIEEGFEAAAFPPAGWTLQEGGDFYTAWYDDNSVAKTGNGSAAAFNTILFFDNAGREEGLITPLVEVPLSSPQLSFDVAFNYHRYTPPYLIPATDFADTLEVLASTDCGATYTRLYKKGGADLATFSDPILNALSVQAAFTNPADSNWRNEQIDLSSLLNGTSSVTAHFKFNYRSSLGGTLNIDNVRVNSTSGTSAQKPASYSIYPNPANETLHIEGALGKTATLTNVMGQIVIKQQIKENTAQLQIAALPAGLYLLTLTEENGRLWNTKIVKR